MVLRGSATKPTSELSTAKIKVEEALDALRSIEERNLLERHNIWDKLEHLEETDKDLNRKEIMDLVHALHHRIVVLENEKLKAEIKVTESYGKVSRIMKQLLAGGIAGCTARTFVAPIDRTKILLQTQFITSGGKANKYTGITQTFRRIIAEEGVSNLWRGNVVNCIRVAPYAAAQFTAYDQYKQMLAPTDGTDFSIGRRMLCGGLAGATATSLTYPLDVIRLRYVVNPDIKGIKDAVTRIYAENGLRTFYKGYFPTLLSLSPFIAVNFSVFDGLKSWYYPDGPPDRPSAPVTLGLGACAGLTAQTICFPLDTIRRRMQLSGTNYKNTLDAMITIPRVEGIRGLYKGMLPNAVKIVPNNGIRFLAFDFLKNLLGAESRKR